jgi:hypothetical protein
LARMKSSFLAFSVPNVFCLRFVWKNQLKLTTAEKNWIQVLTFNRMLIVKDLPYICLLFTRVITNWAQTVYLYGTGNIPIYKRAKYCWQNCRTSRQKKKCCGPGIQCFFAVLRIRIQSGQWIRIQEGKTDPLK